MESVKDIIQQCHERRHKVMQQRETIVTPTLHGEDPYHYIVYCAHRYPLLLHALEQTDISFMPIGQAPFDRGSSVLWRQSSLKTTRHTRLDGRGDGFRRGAFKSIQEHHLHARVLTGMTSSSPTERSEMHLMPLFPVWRHSSTLL